MGSMSAMDDEKKQAEMERIRKDWEEKCLRPALESQPERREAFVTDTGEVIQRVYTPLDLQQAGFDFTKDLNFPGQYPFTRGITPSMYRSEPWIIRSYSGFGEPGACNARYKNLVASGTDEIVIAADLPTQVGYDSDHRMARGEVGKVGVAIDTLRDMETLFEGIPLNTLKRVSLLGNSFAPVALSLFIALGEKQGLTPDQYVVDLQNDILKEYVARGTYIFPDTTLRPGDDGRDRLLRQAHQTLVPFHPLRQSHQRRRRRIDQGRGLRPCQRDLLHERPSRKGVPHR